MHRSGTSLIARLTNLLGVNLGQESDIVQAAPDNPKGFWEHPRFRVLNDELLARLGVSWDTVDTLPAGWQDDPSLDDLRDRAREALGPVGRRRVWPRTGVSPESISMGSVTAPGSLASCSSASCSCRASTRSDFFPNKRWQSTSS